MKIEEIKEICKRIIDLDKKTTGDNWQEGRCCGAIVSDTPPGTRGVDEKTIEFYGGFPISESSGQNDIDFILACKESSARIAKVLLAIIENG